MMVVAPLAESLEKVGQLLEHYRRCRAAGSITEDAEPLDGVRDNAAKLSQTGQQVPLQGDIFGFTHLRMVL